MNNIDLTSILLTISTLWTLFFGGVGVYDILQKMGKMPKVAWIARFTATLKLSFIFVSVLLAVCVVGFTATYLKNSLPCSPFTSTSVTITSPTSNSSVPEMLTVQGSTCHIPTDRQLWLLVQSTGVTGYYPQTGPILVGSNGEWSANAFIGAKGTSDVGMGFTLAVALADQNGNAAILTYIAHNGSGNNILNPLPKGIQLMKEVLVIRG